jgi:hypothetical protein
MAKGNMVWEILMSLTNKTNKQPCTIDRFSRVWLWNITRDATNAIGEFESKLGTSKTYINLMASGKWLLGNFGFSLGKPVV